MSKELIDLVRDIYKTNEHIPLHQPCFDSSEIESVIDVVESSFVSSVGEQVDNFENAISVYTKSKYAIATVNGTSALHMALILMGVEKNNEVLTQSLSFIATSNAILYCDAKPVFIDVDLDSLSLSPEKLLSFLESNAEIRKDGFCWNKYTNRRIKACILMHTFGLPGKLDEVKSICNKYRILLIEDAAESLGSFYKNKHTGTIADIGILSFNGNKIITTGGGGMILTNHELLSKRARHLTTTAKQNHPYLFNHDELGFNYRLPNLNASLGIPQMNKLPEFLKVKRHIANIYKKWATVNSCNFISELPNTKSNYWLNAIITNDLKQRDEILKKTNNSGIGTRPLWTPMHLINFNKKFQTSDVENTIWLFERVINLPSYVPNNFNTAKFQ
ncbi:LegC family aminotransferase [Candidatus Pseudothioglobus singularis]|nr:LegC family aminotransferase [Candidatus Pseudothioglobus singularis]